MWILGLWNVCVSLLCLWVMLAGLPFREKVENIGDAVGHDAVEVAPHEGEAVHDVVILRRCSCRSVQELIAHLRPKIVVGCSC